MIRSAVYGPNDRGNFMSLINWIVKKKRPYPLVGGGKTRKNVLSVHDLVGVFAYLGENIDRLNGEIFNVANPDYLTMREIVETIARAGQFDEEPGSGIAIQIEIEDAVGLKTQEEALTQEIKESL